MSTSVVTPPALAPETSKALRAKGCSWWRPRLQYYTDRLPCEPTQPGLPAHQLLGLWGRGGGLGGLQSGPLTRKAALSREVQPLFFF